MSPTKRPTTPRGRPSASRTSPTSAGAPKPQRAAKAAKARAVSRATTRSSGPKTVQTEASVARFLGAVADATRRADCQRLVELMSRISNAEPKMWGASIVGFGSYRYKYASGREGDWPPIAFSPRKKDLTIYAAPGLDHYAKELSRLGTFTRGVSCLYVKALADIDLAALERILTDSYRKLTASKS